MEGPRAHTSTISNNDAALRRAVRIVAMLNLAYFGVEFGVALAIRLRLTLRRLHRLPRGCGGQRSHSHRAELESS